VARRLRLAVAIGLSLVNATPAAAASFASCWVAREFDPVYAEYSTVTRCRIVGSDTVDYASDSDVPSVLYPNLGTDLTGECWYLTSATTAYVILDRFADGSANIGFDTDPSTPGGIVAIGPIIPRCTSEPSPASDPAAEAWNYVMSYVHDPPQPDLNPVPGRGITGLETFLGVPVPEEHAASLTSGSSALDVEISVDAVLVSWGDGVTDTYPPTSAVLSGYPDGGAIHVYEVKNIDGANVTVEYDWTARWRVAGGAWTPLDVPNTATTIPYPVAEVVSVLGD
jgi:hypothetical protein